jgi:protein-export membrane protein SecD
MKRKGIIYFILTLLLIGFLGYVVVAGCPWFNGKVIRSAKDAIRYGLDLSGGVTITYMPDNSAAPTKDQLETVRKIMVSRLEAKNYFDANVTTSQSNRVIVEIPNLTDPQAAVKELGQTAMLEMIDVGNKDVKVGDILEGEQAVVVKGTEVTSATAAAASTSGQGWEINFTITPEAQKSFADATERLAPTKGRIAITLDRMVISAPQVDEKINSSSARISGSFDEASAKSLAQLINSGALPFKLKPVDTKYVGASLGKNALNVSILAGIISFAAISLFLLGRYRVPGLTAVIGLGAYLLTILFIYARTKITMTLPGIAGIILSLGVAVDANVIIFERIREELRSGKSLRAAIDNGFERAWSAIRDSNVTTLISAIILYIYGIGSIKGFAITLGIGVVVSVAYSMFLARFLTNQLYNMGVNNAKLYGLKEAK